MAKKKGTAKAKIKAEKKVRTAQKVEKKEKKKAGKSRLHADEADDNQDLEGILDQVREPFLGECVRLAHVLFGSR